MLIRTYVLGICAAVLLCACQHPPKEEEDPADTVDKPGCNNTSSIENDGGFANAAIMFTADTELAWSSGGGGGSGGGGKGGRGTNCP